MAGISSNRQERLNHFNNTKFSPQFQDVLHQYYENKSQIIFQKHLSTFSLHFYWYVSEVQKLLSVFETKTNAFIINLLPSGLSIFFVFEVNGRTVVTSHESSHFFQNWKWLELIWNEWSSFWNNTVTKKWLRPELLESLNQWLDYNFGKGLHTFSPRSTSNFAGESLTPQHLNPTWIKTEMY